MTESKNARLIIRLVRIKKNGFPTRERNPEKILNGFITLSWTGLAFVTSLLLLGTIGILVPHQH